MNSGRSEAPRPGNTRNSHVAATAELRSQDSLLRLAQRERNLLLAELRPFHGLFPGGATKTYPRILSQWVVQLSGSRSSRSDFRPEP